MVVRCNGHKIETQKGHLRIDRCTYSHASACELDNALAGFAYVRDLGNRSPTKEFVKQKSNGIVLEFPAGTRLDLVEALEICGPDNR